jgi:RNA polymerase sigma-70 factor (ECF subfamily)
VRDERGQSDSIGELRRAPPDHAEFECWLRQCQRLVYRIAFGVLRDTADAEEITQDVFLRAYRKVSGLRDPGKFRAWVARMSWRLALNRQRAAGRSRRRETSWWQASNPGPGDAEQMAAQREFESRLREEIERLPEKLRAVLLMSAVEDLQAPEIAVVLGIPDGTVRSRLHLARKQLLRAFSDERM